MSAMVKEQHGTYKAHQRGDESVRDTEAHALLSCANRLEAARKPECSREDFVDAVRHNQQLWTLFQSCLCEPDNALPNDLKMLLINISRYVDKASFRAIGESDASVLPGLIGINRKIAAGLGAKPKESRMDSQPSTPSAILTTA
jgi:flagellar biosynthesis activator protein FlaF